MIYKDFKLIQYFKTASFFVHVKLAYIYVLAVILHARTKSFTETVCEQLY